MYVVFFRRKEKEPKKQVRPLRVLTIPGPALIW
jgi:hypothetical protein